MPVNMPEGSYRAVVLLNTRKKFTSQITVKVYFHNLSQQKYSKNTLYEQATIHRPTLSSTVVI